MKADQLIRTIEIKDSRGRVVGTKDVVTYQGLLSKAHEEGLKAIRTSLVQVPTDDNGRTAIAKAAVETEKGQFEALGDASPLNVNSFIVPHLIRMAETRAKARALRDAVNVGVLAFEELDDAEIPGSSERPERTRPTPVSERVARNDGGQVNQPAKPSPSGNGFVPMTEAQRRYLFRILASQGFDGPAAQEALKAHLGVTSLSEVSKAEATSFIDRLLSGEEVPSHGTLER